MKAREVWRHPVNGAFLGAFLDVVGGVVVFSFQDREHWSTMRALSSDGKRLWEKRWKDFAYFHSNGDRLYVDGDKARRISASTGLTEVERDLGRSVDIRWATAAGPIYRIPEEARYFGLDGETLATVWEWIPDRENFTCNHDGRLCRYRPDEGITIFELPSLARIGPIATPPLADFGMHTHVGDLWCHFGASEGGRAAVEIRTGSEVWRETQPDSYGLTVFDDERAYSPRDALTAYDLRTGRQVWRREFGQIPTSMPRVANGRVYIASGDMFAHVIEARTGEVIVSHDLKIKAKGVIDPSPAVPFGERRVLVGTHDVILCLEMD